MFDIGFQELVIIFVVALLVFGPKNLPELAKTIGKWMAEIKRGVHIARSQIENELNADYKLPDEETIKNLPKDLTEGKAEAEKSQAENSGSRD